VPDRSPLKTATLDVTDSAPARRDSDQEFHARPSNYPALYPIRSISALRCRNGRNAERFIIFGLRAQTKETDHNGDKGNMCKAHRGTPKSGFRHCRIVKQLQSNADETLT
jgi:hypothetical protein